MNNNNNKQEFVSMIQSLLNRYGLNFPVNDKIHVIGLIRKEMKKMNYQLKAFERIDKNER